MKKLIAILILTSILFSCNSEKGNMIVTGKIKGLHKGMLYLEKVKDTLLVKVDSMLLDGKDSFTLSDNVESPQIYFLSLSKTDKILQFFGEKGKINIISNLETFGFSPMITGSKNHELMVAYKETMSKFNNQQLDLLKEKFDAAKLKQTQKVAQIEKKINNIPRRKYIYTVNYAVNNADYEIAPYLALSEIYDANPRFLDTIVKSLSPKVSKSLYGKKLIEYLKEVKAKNTDK